MSQQSDIDAAAQDILSLLSDVQGDVTALGTAVTAIQAALAAVPASFDTTALDAAVAQIATVQASLDAGVSAVTNMVPAPPAS